MFLIKVNLWFTLLIVLERVRSGHTRSSSGCFGLSCAFGHLSDEEVADLITGVDYFSVDLMMLACKNVDSDLCCHRMLWDPFRSALPFANAANLVVESFSADAKDTETPSQPDQVTSEAMIEFKCRINYGSKLDRYLELEQIFQITCASPLVARRIKIVRIHYRQKVILDWVAYCVPQDTVASLSERIRKDATRVLHAGLSASEGSRESLSDIEHGMCTDSDSGYQTSLS